MSRTTLPLAVLFALACGGGGSAVAPPITQPVVPIAPEISVEKSLISWFEADPAGGCSWRMAYVPGTKEWEVAHLAACPTSADQVEVVTDYTYYAPAYVRVGDGMYDLRASAIASMPAPPPPAKLNAIGMDPSGALVACTLEVPKLINLNGEPAVADPSGPMPLYGVNPSDARLGRRFVWTGASWTQPGPPEVVSASSAVTDGCYAMSAGMSDTTGSVPTDSSTYWSQGGLIAGPPVPIGTTQVNVAFGQLWLAAYASASSMDVKGPVYALANNQWTPVADVAGEPIYVYDMYGTVLLSGTQSSVVLDGAGNPVWKGSGGAFYWGWSALREPVDLLIATPTASGCTVGLRTGTDGPERTIATMSTCPTEIAWDGLGRWLVIASPEPWAAVRVDLKTGVATELPKPPGPASVIAFDYEDALNVCGKLDGATEHVEGTDRSLVYKGVDYYYGDSTDTTVDRGEMLQTWKFENGAWVADPNPEVVSVPKALADPPCTQSEQIYTGTLEFWRTAQDLGTYDHYSTDSSEYPSLPPNQAFWVDSDGPTVAILAPTDYDEVGLGTTPIYRMDAQQRFQPLSGYSSGGPLRISVRGKVALIGVGTGPTKLVDLGTGQSSWSTDQPVWLWPGTVPFPGEAPRATGYDGE